MTESTLHVGDNSQAQSSPASHEVKQRRVRLQKPSRVLAKVLQRLERLVVGHESGQQPLKQATLVNIVLVQGKIALALHRDSAAENTRLVREAKRELRRAKTDQTDQTPKPDDPDITAFMEYHGSK